MCEKVITFNSPVNFNLKFAEQLQLWQKIICDIHKMFLRNSPRSAECLRDKNPIPPPVEIDVALPEVYIN